MTQVNTIGLPMWNACKTIHYMKKLLGWVILLSCSTSTEALPLITTASGQLQGVMVSHDVVAYKGIPYAAPPVGQLRWRAPQPVTPWSGIRQATQFGHDCMQYPTPKDQALPKTHLSEDCLNLNIWMPAQTTPQKRPVMVWIYGGGFVDGNTSADIYDGTAFAKRGVILVSINYRVGRFGFFAHPALSQENADGLLGNYGYMDQIAALKWVQRNISAFGGDPDNVTLFGESAGGYAIHVLMTSPLAKGLFHKAIIESGGGRVEADSNIRLQKPSDNGYPSAEEAGLRFARRHHITGQDRHALAALRALSADDVMDQLNMETDENSEEGRTFAGPMIDGKLVTTYPTDIYEAGAGIDIPLIVGATGNDIGAAPEISTMSQALDMLGHAHSEQVRQLYNPDDLYIFPAVSDLIASDQMMIEPARFIARTAAAQGQPVYEFRFSYVASSLWATVPGAMHASEVAYVFNTLPSVLLDKVSQPDRAMAEQIQQYWVNFARTGDPNSPSLPHWPRYDPQKDDILIFSPKGVTETRAQPDPWRQRLDLIEQTAPQY